MEYLQILIDDLTEDNFVIGKGEAKAILPQERKSAEYKWLKTGSRDYDTAMSERINLPFNNGMLILRNGDGSVRFDERKLRYSGHYSKDGKYNILVSPTHFREAQRTNIRASKDESFFDYLTRKGRKDFGDPWAYFSMNFAVNAVPVTEEGFVHLFKRSSKAELYPSYWHVIGGMLDINLDLFDGSKNSSKLFKKLLEKAIIKEFKEETATDLLNLKLTGLVYGLTTVDFTYIANLRMSSRDFLSRWHKAVEFKDHSEVAILKSKKEIQDFLDKERIIPTGRGSLILFLKSYYSSNLQ